ncbi:hypothetical protein [Pararhodonellum marinum]|nr:hypothetical protein [Pararhodonellum marinum]
MENRKTEHQDIRVKAQSSKVKAESRETGYLKNRKIEVKAQSNKLKEDY